MLIITSAAYAPAELVAELGQLPPCFLPLGNRRLYARQLSTLKGLRERILLSLPTDFDLEEHDAEVLEAAGVTVVRTAPTQRLAQSLLAILEQYPVPPSEPLRILHGDTLQGDLPLDERDVVAIASNDGYYPRAYVTATTGQFGAAEYRFCQPGDPVLTGYLSFSQTGIFRTLLSEDDDFISIVNQYHQRSASALKVYRTRTWADCGHVNAYYRSRASHTTERVFNELRVERHYIRKRGDKPLKIRAELEWFQQLPAAMRHYAPQIGSASSAGDDVFYDVEYLYSLPLSDLYVFGRLPVEDWGTIFVRCLEFLSECSAYGAPPTSRVSWRGMYLPKTLQRLQEFSEASGWRLDQPTVIDDVRYPSLIEVAQAAQRVIEQVPDSPLTLYHGDFCFSNILYDVRARRIKVIDPRGLGPDGALNCYGDLRYDFGKLFHSVVGGYDFVIAGQITGSSSGQNAVRVHGNMPLRTQVIIERFRQSCLAVAGEAGGERLIAAITVHLFLSMLPLHSDDRERQLALLSRAVALYSNYGFS